MKFRFTQTTVVEFDVDPQYYKTDGQPDPTPEEMLAIDRKNAEDDPIWISMIDDPVSVTLVGEIIER